MADQIGPGESLDIELVGSGFKVRVTHVLDDHGQAIQLRGVDCDLEGDEPGLYAVVARGRGEWSGALSTERSPPMPKSTEKAGRRSTYPAEITEAVRLAKVARGTKNGAPGAKQHVLVRAALPKDATPAEIVKVAGLKSEKQLRAIADGSSTREDLALLRDFGGQFDDPFCKGRNLASMLVAAVTQAKK